MHIIDKTMLASLIEEYPWINYLLACAAVFQAFYFIHIGLDLLDKQNRQDSEAKASNTAGKVKKQ